jgi:hypothetical protein
MKQVVGTKQPTFFNYGKKYNENCVFCNQEIEKQQKQILSNEYLERRKTNGMLKLMDNVCSINPEKATDTNCLFIR